MTSMLGSQGLVLATAMVVSSTVLFLAFSRQKTFFQQLSENLHNHNHNHQDSQDQIPRSCLYSGDKKKEGKTKTKKKKVQFAESVKEPSGNGKEFRNRHKKRIRAERNCGNEIQGMPMNRVALYTGILKDRAHTMECSSC